MRVSTSLVEAYERVEKECKLVNKVCKEVPFFNRRFMKGGGVTFYVKNGILKSKGLDLGEEPLRMKLC